MEPNKTPEVYLAGIGISLGSDKVSVDDLLKDFTDEDLIDSVLLVKMEREKLKKRAGTSVLSRFPNEPEVLEDSACSAIRQAIDNAGFMLKEIDYLSFSTASATGERTLPTPETIIANKLGLENIIAMNIGSGCVGAMFGVRDAFMQLIQDSIDGKDSVYVVAAGDRSTLVLDKKDSILFGEGTAAMVFTNRKVSNGYRLERPFVRSLVAGNELGVLSMEINRDSQRYKMDPGGVLKFVTDYAVPEIMKGLKLERLKTDYYVIPHQASAKILRNATQVLGIPKERVYSEDISLGNFSVASYPIALYHALKKGRVRNDQAIVPVSFGAGNNCGGFIGFPFGDATKIAG